MDYRTITINTWDELDSFGSMTSGYKSIWLVNGINGNSNLHIFKDEKGKCHFAIELTATLTRKVLNPGVNGLSIESNQYCLDGQTVKPFIDLCCNLNGYLEEFTCIIKEIAKTIFETTKEPVEIINHVINTWKSFWANQSKMILSEDEQIGLICELQVLENLLEINPSNALNAWSGPLGHNHDFNFSEWSVEIKGTRKKFHGHTINGIDQLKPIRNKRLAFLSFLIINSENTDAISLQDCIEKIINTTLQNIPNHIVRFNELLSGLGYSPIFSEEYRKLKIEIQEAILYNVDNSFPTLTDEKLKIPLDNRITAIRYDISLEGISGYNFQNINWGTYFY
jgi:hypothetical protein